MRILGLLLRLLALALLVTVLLTTFVLWPPAAPPLVFPDGKKFAFTIVDDTDMASLDRLRPVYAVLDRYGLRTTRTVWVFDSNKTAHSPNTGVTLADPDYRTFILDLQHKGFEIALHGVRGGDSPREETLAGLEEFKRVFGSYPRIHIKHSINADNLYWGASSYSMAPLRWAIGLTNPFQFSGDVEGSKYFWGDVARERIEYVRRFTLSEVNLYRAMPSIPYHIESMPYVNYWFPTANGDRVTEFAHLLSDENLDRLEREGGVCLVYAHLGSGSFNRDGGVDPQFEDRVRAVSSRNGGFVPASRILDFLRTRPGWTGQVGWRERARMETIFVLERVGIW
jgi:hypothetical protein